MVIFEHFPGFAVGVPPRKTYILQATIRVDQWPNPVVYRSAPTNASHPAHARTNKLLPTSWTTTLFTHDQLDAYFENHHNQRLRKCYASLRPWAYRADLFRLAILHDRGGIWMDFTTELLRPLDVLLPSGASLGLVRERPGFGMDYGVFNAFLAVREPRHPFFAAALERSVTVCLARDYGSTPWSITGPELLGRVARDAPRLVRDVTWLRHAPEGGAIETTGERGHKRVAITKHSDIRRFIPLSNAYIGMWKSRTVFRHSKSKGGLGIRS